MALSDFPYPADNGTRLRAYHQLRYLSKNHDVFVVCLTKFPVPEVHVKHLKNFCKELYVLELPKWRRLLNLFNSVANSLPVQVNYCYQPGMKNLIRKLIKSREIDVCFVQQARLGRNIPVGLPGCRYFLDFMDSFSTFSRKRIRYASWYEKPLIEKETERLANYETRIAKQFQACSVISNADKNKFEPELAKDLLVIPNGVEERYLNYDVPVQWVGKKYDLIFTGNMGYMPNVRACLFLVNKILPLLQHHESLKVCLAGAHPATQIWALENHRAVSVTGFVPDLREYLSAARIFVAPLFSGAGLQNKVLEAMALGLPVLASPDTSHALGAVNNQDLIECANEHEFANQIDRLLNNEEEAHSLGLRGRTFVQNNYNWTAANRKLELSLLELVTSAKVESEDY